MTDDYDALADVWASYGAAQDALRERHEAIMAAGAKRIAYIGDATLIEGDCLEILPTLGRVDAVVTDPPYGIDVAKRGSVGANGKQYASSDWDSAARDDVIALIGLDQPSIIWGGNYYSLPPTQCWMIWDKENTFPNFADCELAWTNLKRPAVLHRHLWNGGFQKQREARVHPTQKPAAVMKWCIEHLPADANTILDPFMGSGTTGVAALQLGRRFVGIEIDPGYFDIACKRIAEAWKQPRLFEEPRRKPEPAPSLFDGDAA